MATLGRGTIVEIADRGHFVLAVVQDLDGGKKVSLISETGRSVRLALRAVQLVLPGSLSPTSEALAPTLVSIHSRARDMAERVDTGELWSFADDELGDLSLSSCVELSFDTVEASSVLATWMALRQDTVRFKWRGVHGFDVRDADAVEAELTHQAAIADKLAGRDRFITGVLELLALDKAERRPAILAASQGDPVFRTYLDVVSAYAAGGDGAPQSRDGEALIDEIQRGQERRIRGSRANRAFNLLVELGLWHRDENLSIRRLGLGRSFSQALEAAAERLTQALPAVVERALADGKRHDLRDVLTMTIDAPETLDLDDALSIEVTEDGYRIGVHIAAPESLVPFGSPLEEAARKRGSSGYFPTHTIPMFPRQLSDNALSLVAGEDRLAMSFIAEVDDFGEIAHEEVLLSVIRVDERLTFHDADELLELGSGRLFDALRDLYTVADGIYASRAEAGAIHVPLPERKVRVDREPSPDDDTPLDVRVSLYTDESMARMLVGEMAVLANTIAARFCAAERIPVTYRTQEAPSPSIEMADFDDVPAGYVRGYAIRRKMLPARPSTVPGRHFALAVDAYLQATSPIRRYGDLMAHYQMHHVLETGVPMLDEDEMRAVQRDAEHAAGQVLRAQRESDRYWSLRYYESMEGQIVTAIIVDYPHGDKATKATVFMEDTAFQASVNCPSHIALGSQINVLIDGVNPRANQLLLRYSK